MQETEFKEIDIGKLYDSDPESALKTLETFSAGRETGKIVHGCSAFDISGLPSSMHLRKVINIYGTVLRVSSVKFREENKKHIDYQEIRVQERSNVYVSQTITVFLNNSLVNTCQAGETVKILGIVHMLWRKIRIGCPVECDYVVHALCVQKQRLPMHSFSFQLPNNEYAALMHILSKYAPQIVGSITAKLGLLLCTVGGCAKKEDRESEGTSTTEELYRETQHKVRSFSNILLVGKPSTGKTDLLMFASKTCIPSVFTTGIGCSSAGLTACAVRESGTWTIERGALPQADGGICCIDEFTLLKKEDKASILEAMEQQCITVAKVGILMRLDTRCTVAGAARHLAAERSKVLPSLNLSPPLISRFDLILLLDDNTPGNIQIADAIIERVSDEKEVAYIKKLVHARRPLTPLLLDEAREIISLYYEKQRNAPYATIRTLESHIRLTEAYAKIHGRENANENDALVCTLLLMSSLSSLPSPVYNIEKALSSENTFYESIKQVKEYLYTI